MNDAPCRFGARAALAFELEIGSIPDGFYHALMESAGFAPAICTYL